jgi:diaminopimelate epimerase
MNGLGNEITVLDLRGTALKVSAAEARAIAAAPAFRFDQLMVLHDPVTDGTDAFVRIYNTDGSEAGACGNGTRCVAWALTRERPRTALRVETIAGLLDCAALPDGRFSVDMGRPRFGWRDIPLGMPVADTTRVPIETDHFHAGWPKAFTAVSMGNPHAVFFVDDVDAHWIEVVGPELERHPLFPERANIGLAHVTGRGRITLRVWERGAGLTRACGSGACAAAVAGARTDLTDRAVAVTLPGGTLDILWRDDDRVIMTGPVAFEHEGPLPPALFETAA